MNQKSAYGWCLTVVFSRYRSHSKWTMIIFKSTSHAMWGWVVININLSGLLPEEIHVLCDFTFSLGSRRPSETIEVKELQDRPAPNDLDMRPVGHHSGPSAVQVSNRMPVLSQGTASDLRKPLGIALLCGY